MTGTRTIDALGTYCPVPIHLLEEASARARSGTLFLVLADDPMIEVDLPAWCHRTGSRLVRITEADGEWTALVETT